MTQDPKLTDKPEPSPELAPRSAPRNVPVRTALKAGADDSQQANGCPGFWRWNDNSGSDN